MTEESIAALTVLYGFPTLLCFAYAMTDGVTPERTDDMTSDALVVWRVLWAMAWPVRLAWLVASWVRASVRAALAFVRWALGRVARPRMPRARTVNR